MTRKKIEKIHQAEKIAAGEVVERPANIIKELIENSIDADAKEVRIFIKKAGKNVIQVIDDGIGIPPDEIELAFERFTSSKIRSINDLDTLTTLGFRGEALASIAAVSQVEIISRTIENDHGIQLIIHGGKKISKKELSCPVGTNIVVKNIFYNIPARQKFLKSDSTELGHTTDIIQRYSLAYPNIHFIYMHNELSILNCPASNDIKTTVFHIYGKKVAEFLEEVDFTEGSFKVSGVLGHPQIARKSRGSSSLFINKRYIISDVLFRAVKEAYGETLMVGKHPFFVLFLETDPSTIDFNIHPKKLHVRFENEEYIYNKFYNIIRKVVEDEFIIKEKKYIATELEDYTKSDDESSPTKIKLETSKTKRPIKEIRDKKKKPKTEKKEEIEKVYKPVQLKLTDQKSQTTSLDKKIPDTYIRDKYIISDNFPKVKLISYTGQLSNNIYIVLEGINEDDEEGLFILDQHAASERITKEKLRENSTTLKNTKQRLIAPLKVEVSPSEKIFLLENVKQIRKLGFGFEHFGGSTFILRETPTIMGKLLDTNIIQEIISDITSIGKDKSFSEVKEEIINYLACHKSIRGGDDLTLKEVRNLLVDLSKCKDSYHCAHGRPTLKFISYKELDKLFKRIV